METKEYIFFDIDRVLFDTEKFITLLIKEISECLDGQEINLYHTKAYEQTRNECDHFDPSYYIHLMEEISKKENIGKDLRKFFNNNKNYTSCSLLGKDNILEVLSNKFNLGIISWGETIFQNKKLESLGILDLFNKEDIFIFDKYREKTFAVKEICKKYNVICAVDDDINMINEWSQHIKYPVLMKSKSGNIDQDSYFKYEIERLDSLKEIVLGENINTF